MAATIRRRTLLAAGAGAVAAGLPIVPALAGRRPARSIRFTLNAEVLDGGEQVTSVTLHTSRLGRVDPTSLSTDTFSVRAKATSPIPVAAGDVIFTEYDLDRQVVAVRLNRDGNVVLELASGEGVAGAATLGYIAGKGRNVVLDLDYTITQDAPIVLRGSGSSVTIGQFRQGRLSSPEVDAFDYHRADSGLKYRLFSPRRRRGRRGSAARGDRPLIVWLHGGGEGALLPDGYYDNETTLRANRGALGFATEEAQEIFGGAYVVAPQSTPFWLEDGSRFAPLIHDVIAEVVDRHRVDPDRIYVVGASNGGYMTLKMTTVYPELFAASVPICPVVTSLQPGGPRMITDQELEDIETRTWLVHSRDDATVPAEPNSVRASELIPRARLTLYDDVTWNGYRFPGHWSWIYVARNDPSTPRGVSIWEWMARRRRR